MHRAQKHIHVGNFEYALLLLRQDTNTSQIAQELTGVERGYGPPLSWLLLAGSFERASAGFGVCCSSAGFGSGDDDPSNAL